MQQRSNREELFLHLGRLEGKVDAILSNQTSMDKRLGEQEKRLGLLEQHRPGYWERPLWWQAWLQPLLGFSKEAPDAGRKEQRRNDERSL